MEVCKKGKEKKMPCNRLGNAIVCGAKLYRFKGWFFEWGSYTGPWPLKKDGELKKNAGRKFWMLINEFQEMSIKERETYRVA